MDNAFISSLASKLQELKHVVQYDKNVLNAGDDWRKQLASAIRSADVFVPIISDKTGGSQWVFQEIGHARALADVNGGTLILPVIVGRSTPIPPAIADLQAVIVDQSQADEAAQKISTAANAFAIALDRKSASRVQRAEDIRSHAPAFIKPLMDKLDKAAKRDRLVSYVWYAVGLVVLIGGVVFGLIAARDISEQPSLAWQSLVLLTTKTLVAVGFLGAASKYAFSLGGAYASEARKHADRYHAISFGDFYLKIFGADAGLAEVREVFQHWNIDPESSFSRLDSGKIDPKIIASFVAIYSKLAKQVKSK